MNKYCRCLTWVLFHVEWLFSSEKLKRSENFLAHLSSRSQWFFCSLLTVSCICFAVSSWQYFALCLTFHNPQKAIASLLTFYTRNGFLIVFLHGWCFTASWFLGIPLSADFSPLHTDIYVNILYMSLFIYLDKSRYLNILTCSLVCKTLYLKTIFVDKYIYK